MAEPDFLDIDSVVVPPEYCHRCGSELVTREREGEEYPWCQDCEVAFGQVPAPGAHVVVHDDENVLVLDEPIPQHEGLLSLPGGYAR
jgi:NADH pyrophosphatase NudC (nudix superfamily)